MIGESRGSCCIMLFVIYPVCVFVFSSFWWGQRGWRKSLPVHLHFKCVNLPLVVCLVCSSFPRSVLKRWIPRLFIWCLTGWSLFSFLCLWIVLTSQNVGDRYYCCLSLCFWFDRSLNFLLVFLHSPLSLPLSPSLFYLSLSPSFSLYLSLSLLSFIHSN